MRLSTKSRFSLRLLIQIGLSEGGTSPVKGKDLAKTQDISEAYIEQIMIPLKGAGIIGTIRGCNGGYILNKLPAEITILDLIELFEGKIAFADCHIHGKKYCNRIETCPTQKIWDRLSGNLRNDARQITLQSILDKMRTKKTEEYVI
ncbi:MAG: Rrf2 family transcriptional regulator [Verrucomicrobiota bacterium]|nr:Rrf2 family transcriptional regulator [Verrucomicrobiota bacterium]